MIKPRFVHLRVRSDYSMVDGINKVSALVKRAAALHMPALAITDFTNLCGLIKFYSYAHSVGIKPIIGADFFVQSRILGNELAELTILAANHGGYKNLILLISKAFKRGYDSYGPAIDLEWLVEHNKGLILLSGGSKGDVGKFLIREDLNCLNQCLSFYGRYFPNSYYIELVQTGRLDEEAYLYRAIDLATRKGLPVVATNDVRFISPKDFNAHEIRVAIHNGFTLHDAKRPKKYSPQQYMRSQEEMCNLFAEFPEALANSVEIALRCNVVIRSGGHFLPNFRIGETPAKEYLIHCARQGLNERLLFLFPDCNDRYRKRQAYEERLNTELQVINQMGFAGYFLIVMEFIQWSKDHGIPVGPGRGSGAGSLVAYSLKITDLDPLTFGLLFERFLNPERVSMPDFDIDFCMEKRDLVIAHVAKTYGYEAVSQIITFGTMTAKAVIRDVGRALGYPYSFVNRVSKLIPVSPGMTLKKALIAEPQLQAVYNSDEDIKNLFDIAKKLEGVTRNPSKHAGGVVIAPTKITDFSPIYCDPNGKHPVTQFDKDDIEKIGLVKFDFLGLRTLSIIDKAIEAINSQRKTNGLEAIDIRAISLHDQKSFEILQKAETTAIFQLESQGMRDLIRRLKPDRFEDIIALIALFRPGPLQSGMVENFINRKQGKEAISYPDVHWQHPLLQSVLESTYGIILYQEQVMQIAQVLAGYTLGSADILRRAMGKKNPKEMSKQRSVFKIGAEKIGINCKLAMKIFDLVEKFAGYGFNKSHSAAYALVSYQTLWLKAHYPAEFMAAAMTSDMDNTEKIVGLINECLRMGLKVLPPDINYSQKCFKVNKNGEIVYGIGAIKGVGEEAIETIIKARNQNGHFIGLFDLCIRTDSKKLNRYALEKLIISGACDSLGPNRATLIHSLEDALRAASQCVKNETSGQIDMFNLTCTNSKMHGVSYRVVKPWSDHVLLQREREALGLYLTGHPINQYLDKIKRYTKGLRFKDIQYDQKDRMITIAGLVVSIRMVLSKKGERMSICVLDDGSGCLEVVCFSDLLERKEHLIEKDHVLLVRGTLGLDKLKGNIKIKAKDLMKISKV